MIRETEKIFITTFKRVTPSGLAERELGAHHYLRSQGALAVHVASVHNDFCPSIGDQMIKVRNHPPTSPHK